MLESLAINLLNIGEAELSALGILLIVVGFIVGIALRRGKSLSLRRVPYFIWSSTVFGLGSTLPLAWLLTFEAARNGVLWALVAFVFGGVFLAGVANGVLGHARSVNAYGDGSRAWMGIVPFANLALMFKRPLDWKVGTWGRFAVNTLGIIFGFLLMAIGSAVEKDAEREIASMASSAQNDPAMQQTSIEMMLLSQGLEETLRQLAAGVPREKVDETTTVLRVEGIGTRFRLFSLVFQIRYAQV